MENEELRPGTKPEDKSDGGAELDMWRELSRIKVEFCTKEYSCECGVFILRNSYNGEGT